MSDDEEDELVAEIPIYLNHELESNLYVHQYPVRLTNVNSGFKVIGSKIRPNNDDVLLEVENQIDNSNYDTLHGERIASSVDDDKAVEKKFYKSTVMDKIEWVSQKNPNKNNCAVGMFIDKEFHITPIKGVVQLLPSLTFLDKQMEKEDSKKEEPEAKQVRVKFARNEIDKGRLLREQSRAAAQEPWYTTEFFDFYDPESEIMRKKLISTNKEISEFDVKKIFGDMLPVKPAVKNEEVPLPENTISVNSLRNLPLENCINLIMKEVKVINLSHLSGLCSEPEAAVLNFIQQIAVLVQGNWVLRSDIMFPEGSSSHSNGIPAEVMVQARDYILYKLNKSITLDRKIISSIVRLPPDEMKEVTAQVCRLRYNKLWQFRLSPDVHFIRKYPDIVEQQELLWESRFKRLKQIFEEEASNVKELANRNDVQSPRRQRRRKNSSMSSSDEMCGESPKTKRKRRKSVNYDINNIDKQQCNLNLLKLSNFNSCDNRTIESTNTVDGIILLKDTRDAISKTDCETNKQEIEQSIS